MNNRNRAIRERGGFYVGDRLADSCNTAMRFSAGAGARVM